MNKFIRHRTTKHYLKEDGGWTADLAEAWCFQDLGRAVDRVIELQVFDVEMCYALPSGAQSKRWDYVVPFR